MEKLPFQEPHLIEESDDLTKRLRVDSDNLNSFATNVGLFVLCAIASIVSFWEVEFTIDKAFTIGWVTVLLYVVSTTVYRTKYDGGIYRGRQTEPYKTIMTTFQGYRERITKGKLIDRLREWCQAFRINDVKNVRMEIICPYMSYDEYLAKYVNLSPAKIKELGLSRKVRSAVNRANAVEPVELTADMLLNTSFSKNLFGKRRILPRSGDEQRRGDFASNYAKRLVITILCGLFAVEFISDPSVESFLQWIIRMIPVVMAFLTGDTGGFRNATEVTTKRIDAQSRLLELFFADEKIEIVS